LLVAVVLASVSAMPLKRRSPAHFPTSFGYHAHKPHECNNPDVYRNCYICGKFAESELIYRGCCRRMNNVMLFCERFWS
jgi:hypothetical protein